MRIIKNTLQIQTEQWTDPGVYPSNAGGGPLPPQLVVADVKGELHVLVTKDEVLDSLDSCHDLQSALDLTVDLDYCVVDSWVLMSFDAAEDGMFLVVFVPYHWTDTI